MDLVSRQAFYNRRIVLSIPQALYRSYVMSHDHNYWDEVQVRGPRSWHPRWINGPFDVSDVYGAVVQPK